MKTKSKILKKEYNYIAKHRRLIVKDGNWPCDHWRVTIEEQEFDYYTGIGHRKKDSYKLAKTCYHQQALGWLNKEVLEKFMNTSEIYLETLERVSKVVSPDLDDVLCALITDSEALEESFKDWAANFGYSSDSIKAKEIYEACQKNTFKLKTFLDFDLAKARKVFRDY